MACLSGNQRFVPNLFGKGQLFKTGDLAYRRDDGKIIFCGRNDFQIKINGQRVEVGEIEAAMSDIDGIETTVVLLSNVKGREILIAVYSGQKTDDKILQERLSVVLPSYMIPKYFYYFENIPLNNSGK